MTEKQRDWVVSGILLSILVAYFARMLFTDQIIRAPDIINEFYWGVKDSYARSIWDALKIDLRADWDMYGNSGDTTEGGWVSSQFLIPNRLILSLIPPPASVAWHIVLYLFAGGAGTYAYCRLIGCSRTAALLGGLVFAVAPENASLINAGHVLKISTICMAPWAFYLLEKSIRTERLFYFLSTALLLAFQFFQGHWQISFYTCLGVGLYAIIRTVLTIIKEKPPAARISRIALLNVCLLVFFITSVSISLIPLAHWSKETNRGAQSGANQGKGGLDREEAMSWSLPPEEVATFAIPGLFGLSRQEAGPNPPWIRSYYWGRMVFTQTTDYMGLLPWLLLPLAVLFRRDRYTALALVAVFGGLLFSMGKYSPAYRFLFDYFPGIDRFRVPKMMMFMTTMGLGIMAARGLDCLTDADLRNRPQFRYWLLSIAALPLSIISLLATFKFGGSFWINKLMPMLTQPTRYEQGMELVVQRWNNILFETALAAIVASVSVAAIWICANRIKTATVCGALLICLYLADTGRINHSFIFLTEEPKKSKREITPAMDFLLKSPKDFRSMPINIDPLKYVVAKIPVLFAPHPVQQKRWQDVLDNFSYDSAFINMLNIRYFVMPSEQYAKDQAALPKKLKPVFKSPDGSEIILENPDVLPKAWLVPSAVVQTNPYQALMLSNSPDFDPRRLAIVESPPPIALQPPFAPAAPPKGNIKVLRLEGEKIDLDVSTDSNSLLVTGEKFDRGWKAFVSGKEVPTYPVNYLLRGLYLTPGKYLIEFRYDPKSFRIGKALTLTSFALFILVLGYEIRRKFSGRNREETTA